MVNFANFGQKTLLHSHFLLQFCFTLKESSFYLYQIYFIYIKFILFIYKKKRKKGKNVEHQENQN